MTCFLKLTVFMVPLLAAPAWAGKPAPGAKPAATPPDPSAAAGTQDIANLCSDDKNKFPGKDATVVPRKPIAPIEFTGDNPKRIEDTDLPNLRFQLCRFSRFSDDSKKTCDFAFAKILQLYTTVGGSYVEKLAKICDDIEKETAKCSGQSESSKCTGALYKKASDDFNGIAADMKKASDALALISKKLSSRAEAESKRKEPDGTDKLTENQHKAAVIFASNTMAAKIDPDRDAEPLQCFGLSGVGGQTEFCGNAIPANDAMYFSKLFVKKSTQAADNGKKYGDLADKANKNANNGSSITGDGQKDKGLLGGMGLDDLMKMGTLGLTGASLYCSLTKNCSPQQQQQSDLSGQQQPGATSPTPNASNTSGPEKSSLGDNGKPAAGTSSTGTNPDTATASFHGGGVGTGGFSANDPLANHFAGNLGHAGSGSSPATASASGSGGGGFGGFSGGQSGASPDAGNRAPASTGGDGGFAPLGGGLASAGTGFSLGDAHGGTPTDNALKNILNGDAPPGSPTDPALSDLGGATPSAAAGSEAGMDDPENLFVRTKDAHVRCLKRGCVGREIGSSI
jgi:hypothetical protein